MAMTLQAHTRRNSRGEERRPVHQGAVVVVADEVVHFGGVVADVGSVGDLHLDGVAGVVEVNDVDVEDQHRRWRNDITWCQDKTKHRRKYIYRWEPPSPILSVLFVVPLKSLFRLNFTIDYYHSSQWIQSDRIFTAL